MKLEDISKEIVNELIEEDLIKKVNRSEVEWIIECYLDDYIIVKGEIVND